MDDGLYFLLAEEEARERQAAAAQDALRRQNRVEIRQALIRCVYTRLQENKEGGNRERKDEECPVRWKTLSFNDRSDDQKETEEKQIELR
ncbi:hypothetical protein G7Y89_g6030 [Cudoniella acicularis]|uniref:Uncharacterized protein n=1 Tax=Cudoniella acicularis TaxID=354080 RepID=A0A8H4W558_9HELO|nr:hypothetical protein G7Y89_g6030 [Cudoniella acicularis]